MIEEEEQVAELKKVYDEEEVRWIWLIRCDRLNWRLRHICTPKVNSALQRIQIIDKKTEGIVLRSMKHQEANLITTLYTREYGVMSFIITGYRSTRSRRKHSYFQPLSIVDIVFQQRPNRDLHKISESKVAYLLHEVQSAPIKLSLGLAMMEIFYDVVKEGAPTCSI